VSPGDHFRVSLDTRAAAGSTSGAAVISPTGAGVIVDHSRAGPPPACQTARNP